MEILGKRLLSCPTAFAESWRRCREAVDEAEAAADAEVLAVNGPSKPRPATTAEAQSREATAAGVVGAWLKTVAPEVKEEIGAIDRVVAGLGFDTTRNNVTAQDPAADARFDKPSLALIDEAPPPGKTWRG
ncbi:MAG: hypothetical protein R2712_12375 [Vicinamibacterales bacterium]